MADYIPDRGDVIWLDFEPTKAKEIGKYRPALVLSPRDYAKATGFIVACPISTSIRGNEMEVPINGLDNPSVVVSTVVNTYSWKERRVKKITMASCDTIEQVLIRLVPIIGAEVFFN